MESLRRAVVETDRARALVQDVNSDVGLLTLQRLTSGQWEMTDWFDAEGRRFLLMRQVRTRSLPTRIGKPGELEVASSAALGETGKQMGYRLGVSPARVSRTVRSLMRKLRVKTHAELVMQIRCLGLAGLGEGSQADAG